MNENSLKNLKTLSPNEARINGRVGGIKSGECRARKRALKEIIEELINQPISDKKSEDFVRKFFPHLENRDFNVSVLGLARIFKDLTNPNTKPNERIKIFEFLRDTLEGKPIQAIQIDPLKQEEFEIDKRLAQMSDEELLQIIYGKDVK